MAHYFSASAFRDLEPSRLAADIVRYARSHDVTCREFEEAYPINEHTDATLYEQINGWTVVIWPVHFNIHDVRLCADVTRNIGSLAVTVNVYADAFWSHEVLNAGALVDKFAPWADYFAEDNASAAAARETWRGDPDAAAAALNVSPSALAPYYRYVGGDDDPGKAHPDDEFSSANFWVFTDLWRRIGIKYPSNPDAFVKGVRWATGFGTNLPTWEGEAL